MTPSVTIQIEIGNISKHIEITDIVLRQVPKYGISEEFDGNSSTEYEESESNEIEYEYRLQARIINKIQNKLCDIKYDVSFYNAKGNFLGLNRSRLVDEDEMDIDDQLPIDMRVDIPESASACTFNIRAKQAGIISRLFWG